MSTSPLPTRTELLTSLFAALPPLPSTTPLPSNPLLSAPPSTKSLFLTLHALFPNEFLPALDLLDRGLVTRVVIRHQKGKERGREREGASILSNGGAGAEDREPGEGEGDDAAAAAAHTSRPRDGADVEPNAEDRDRDQEQGQEKVTTKADNKTAQRKARNEVHYVHSAAAATTTQRAGRYPSTGLETKSYEVRLRAWNCSCPAFTFAAFSSTPTSSVAPLGRSAFVLVDVEDGIEEALDGGEGGTEGGGECGMDMGREGEDWVFGGLPSLWAAGEETMPVCKHLLACVVGERCGLLAEFVAERVVSKGEGAGLGAGWGG